MKKYLLVFAILTSMFSIVNVSQANANCTEENPCGVWAVLDNFGTVTNVIVCQTSVCGSGTFGGQTVVPQVAPNPVTHDTYGQGSYIGNKEQGTEVKYSEGTFTIHENKPIVNSFTEVNEDTTTVSEVEIAKSSKSFKYEDTIGKKYGEIIMNNLDYGQNSSTSLTVTQTNVINTIQESIILTERKTTQEIEEIFVDNNLNLLLSKIQILISLLGSWVK